MKVLIVDPDARRVGPLQQALIAGGAEVSVAPSGSFALTMLEWNRQDVLVSRAHIDDMEGHELCAILRSDPSMRGVRFVLVAAPEEMSPVQTAAAGVDLVLPEGVTDAMMLMRLVQLVRQVEQMRAARRAAAPAPADAVADEQDSPAASRTDRANARENVDRGVGAPPEESAEAVEALPSGTNGSPPRVAAASHAPSAPAAVPAGAALRGLEALAGGARTFQGALDVMELPELTQAIALGGKTGRLILALSAGGGLIAFEAGRVVHAEFQAAVGEDAFEALIATAHRDRSGKFCFIPSAAPLADVPRTVERSVEALLLSIATAMDEGR